tara:strand:- start:320 stop:688 length:369 start_codon:yes stop_codon:yes gene_type:complete
VVLVEKLQVNKSVDNSLILGEVIEHISFTVPSSVDEERVQDKGPNFRNKAGGTWEGMGFKVLAISGPDRCAFGFCKSWLPTDEDRRRYHVRARVSREPVDVNIDVPDEAVLPMEEKGFKLLD